MTVRKYFLTLAICLATTPVAGQMLLSDLVISGNSEIFGTLSLDESATLDLSEGTLILPSSVTTSLGLADTAVQPGDPIPWADITGVPIFPAPQPGLVPVAPTDNPIALGWWLLTRSGWEFIPDYIDDITNLTIELGNLGSMAQESADDYVAIAPRLLTDSGDDESLDWQNRRLHVGEVYTVDYGQSRLVGVAPGDVRLDWLDRYLYGHWEVVGNLDVTDLNISGSLNIPAGSIQPADLAPDAVGAIPAGTTATTQSTSYTWSPEANGDTLRITTTGDVVLSLSSNSLSSSRPATLTVIALQDGTGNRALTWGGSNIRAAGGSMPSRSTSANARDIYQFLWDGQAFHLVNHILDLSNL